jgi:branched-chain amino acid transport system substrate-binding protein
MVKMKRFWCRNICSILLAVVLSFLIGAFFGCSKKQPETSEIKIGILTPLTGDVASWGEMQKRSTDLALEKVNLRGGIRGRKVKVLYEDDQANPKVGVNTFNKLATVDKVAIVVGCPASNVTLSIAPIANKEKVVLLSSGSTATKVGEAGPYIFRIMPSDEIQSSIMANWAWDLGFRKIAIIYEQNAWGSGLMEAFKRDFSAKGGNIVLVEGSDPGTTDFRSQLSKIKSIDPNAIYAPLYTKGAGLMIKQAREMGIKQQFLGADVYETPELVEAGGSAVDGVLYTKYGEYHGSEYQAFEREYKEKYKIDTVEAYAQYCYDAFMIAIEALTIVPHDRELNGENVRDALLSISNYRGVTGISDFNGKNSASGKTFDKMTVQNGKHIPYNPSGMKK